VYVAATHAGKVAAVEADTGRVADHTSFPLAKDTWLAPFGHVIQRTPFDSGEIKMSGALAGLVGEVAPPLGPKAVNHGQFSMTQVVVSPDGRTALYSARTPGAVTWHLRSVFKDVASGRVVAGPQIVSPWVLAWRPDGRAAAVAGSGVPNPTDSNVAFAGHVHLLDPRTGERTALIPTGAAATALDWSGDGRRIAVGTADGGCSVWDPVSGKRLAGGRLHASRVNDVAWSPDGLRVASGSDGGRVHVWDAATTPAARAFRRRRPPAPLVARRPQARRCRGRRRRPHLGRDARLRAPFPRSLAVTFGSGQRRVETVRAAVSATRRTFQTFLRRIASASRTSFRRDDETSALRTMKGIR
jgi:hypothetical protein